MERIAELTRGRGAVNPNTMYPLLRGLEAEGLLAGEWEHPERRSRRFYRTTAAGEGELDALRRGVGHGLDRLPRLAAATASCSTGSPARSRPSAGSCPDGARAGRDRGVGPAHDGRGAVVRHAPL